MRSIRTLFLSSVIAALTVSALAVPTAAADKGKMTVVNGMPNTRIDVCIGSTNELRSGLKYGKVFKKQLIGSKKLRFRVASPGTCKGKVLAGKTVDFAAGSDQTIVVTKKAPKVLVFDNAGLGTQAAADPDGAIALRHTADLYNNEIYMRWSVWNDPFIKDWPFPPTPGATETPFDKGDEFTNPLYVDDDVVMLVKATRADPTVVVAQAPVLEQLKLRRYEFILVGTAASNAKIVTVISALTAAPPAVP